MKSIPFTPIANPKAPGIRPLHLAGSLLLFGMPALAMFASMHAGLPALERAGLTPFEAFIVATTVPMAILLAAALAALVREQGIESLAQLGAALRTRMRFPRLTRRAILLGLGTYGALLLVGGIFAVLERTLVAAGFIPLPQTIPALLDPRVALDSATLARFAGGQLAGNWGIIVLFGLHLFFNIAGEELWWRGYILPRQELAFGRRAWIVHGLMWTAFHAFKWWNLLSVLPLALILSFAAQRSRNNWVPVIAHLLANTLLLWLLVAGVLGR